MKRKSTYLLILFCSGIFTQARSQSWQQQVDYNIEVSLNADTKSLDGNVELTYHNNSPDTLSFIYIHLWPNAYKNDRTAFSEQLLTNRNTSFYFSQDSDRGYINNLSFSAGDNLLQIEPHKNNHIDIIKVLLEDPLLPHQKLVLSTPFHLQLPKVFSRSGYRDSVFQITQWFPKAALYDQNGWHEMPYLDQGEFFDNFGDYIVKIVAAKELVIAATGNLISEEIIGNIKTSIFKEQNIHDFAWFASNAFKEEVDSIDINDQKILITHFYLPGDSIIWTGSTKFTKRSIQYKSDLLGTYPYKTLKVVSSPGQYNSGMEYPTITILNASNKKDLDMLINHEAGHNWFQGILASNERDEPWMDEGMNTYFDKKYESKFYPDTLIRKGLSKKLRNALTTNEWLNKTLYALRIDQPITTSSSNFNQINYNLIAYNKTANWLELLEQKIGEKNMEDVFRKYYQKWKFRHPSAQDFQNVTESVTGQNLDSIFSLLQVKGDLNSKRNQIGLTPYFSFDQSPKTNWINFMPAVGYNYYDKIMLGLVVHNYNLPPTPLQFLAAPLYGTGSKSINGLGRVSYTIHPFNDARKIILAGAFSRFNSDEFTDSTGRKNFQPFTKFTPSVKYEFGNRNLKAYRKNWVQYKFYNITETALRFNRDTVQNVFVISYPKEKYFIHDLTFGVENNRVLYPYEAILKAEKGEDFGRLSFTGKYFFNYANGGGASIRIFAGKFIYVGDKSISKQFSTERFHLNLSGPEGYEDYTYSNYFVGRNEFDGFSNRQIMIRDGAFKVKTDLLSSKIGKTDDWLSALNFTTTIPDKINPLSILPVKIPVKVFADIGTYAEAWDRENNKSRFLFDAGFQLSLLKNVINIYFPIIYSKVYTDYFKSTVPGSRFKNNISFSIDFSNLEPGKLFPSIKL